MKNNKNKRLVWDITKVKSVEDVTPSLTKAKILNSGINISELENLVKHALHTVYTTVDNDVKKITPWYKKLWKLITGKK